MIIEQSRSDYSSADGLSQKSKSFRFPNFFRKFKSPSNNLKGEKVSKFSLSKLFKKKVKTDNECDQEVDIEFSSGYGKLIASTNNLLKERQQDINMK